jgi:hypothetical protein
MTIDETTFGLICGAIILLASTVTAIFTIYNTIKNPAKKFKEKQDAEFRDKICQTLKEVLPELLREHDLELRDRYKADRDRYLHEIESSVLSQTQEQLNQVKILGIQYESLVISARDVLREKITKLYTDNVEDRTLSILEKERLDQFYKDYKSLNGNSYIDKYYNRMSKWAIKDDEYDDNTII